MKFIETPIKDLYIIEPELNQDKRGRFYRIFCKKDFKTIEFSEDIVQINLSLTKKKGSIRGMHFQFPPKAEIKMVKCIQGSVFDVAIDLRENSPTFLKWHGEILSSENLKMILIPKGFAHGFQILEKNSELLYFHSEFYTPELESGIRYNDPKINIRWPLEITQISDRDKNFEYIHSDFKGIKI